MFTNDYAFVSDVIVTKVSVCDVASISSSTRDLTFLTKLFKLVENPFFRTNILQAYIAK